MNREEQIEKARELLACGVLSKETCNAIKNDFPELRESEDEKIRKEIIHYIINYKSDNVSEEQEHTWLAWLEKQKTYEPNGEDERIMEAIEGTIRVYGKTQGAYLAGYDMDTLVVHLRNAFASLEKQKEEEGYEAIPVESTLEYKLGFKAGKESEKQKEQKPKPNYCHYGGDPSVERCKYCSAACSARLTEEQKPVEWSEEDERIKEHIINLLANYAEQHNPVTEAFVKRDISWLISLRPSWKPSEEQMKALERTTRLANFGLEEDRRKALVSLYEQLKAL